MPDGDELVVAGQRIEIDGGSPTREEIAQAWLEAEARIVFLLAELRRGGYGRSGAK